MTAEGGTARKVPTQGCPQGSILGPDCWNYVMDELLNQAYPDGCEIQAYADDVAILVTGRSRTEIERKANEAMETVQVWLTRNRIQLSIDKCCYVLFGNSLSRDPTVGFSGGRIHRTRSFSSHQIPRYLVGRKPNVRNTRRENVPISSQGLLGAKEARRAQLGRSTSKYETDL
ncbi:hypothetical protein M8J76_005180 [Diaphorina citri]|nr:hypothetical protein M8J76_005180 [Diaphorina citri]